MIVTYQNTTLITAQGIKKNTDLTINSRTGTIMPNTQADAVQDGEHLYLYPALINAHDHLELNHYPRSKPRPQYTNAQEWAADMSAQLDQEPYRTLQKYPLWDRCLMGGMKNLLSGVTTVAHHNPLHRPLKHRHFPVDVLRDYAWAHSLYLTPPDEIQRAHRKAKLFMIHLAEGIHAANEFDQLSELGCATDKALLIHGVSLPERAINQVRGLVWCPSTNLYLLGQTAQVSAWYTVGKLALGSDSLLTAEGDLLDELRVAHQTGQLTPEQLFHTVTDLPARLLNLPERGDLQIGLRADMLALPAHLHPDPYQALIRAKRSDIQWVMRSGKIIWQHTQDKPNCSLDDVPYQLDPSIYRLVKRSRLKPSGLTLLL